MAVDKAQSPLVCGQFINFWYYYNILYFSTWADIEAPFISRCGRTTYTLKTADQRITLGWTKQWINGIMNATSCGQRSIPKPTNRCTFGLRRRLERICRGDFVRTPQQRQCRRHPLSCRQCDLAPSGAPPTSPPISAFYTRRSGCCRTYFESGEMEIDALNLKKSTLTSDGPIYKTLKEVKFS